MIDHLAKLRELLALSPDDVVEDLTRIRHEDADHEIASGLAPSAAAGDVRERILAEPHFTVDGELTRSLGLTIERWDGDTAVIGIATEPEASTGAVTEAAGRWILNPRHEGGALAIATPMGEILFLGEANLLVAKRIVRAHAAPALAAPTPSELLGDWQIPSWLRQLARTWHASTSPVGVAASIGVIGRLATAIDEAPRRRVQAILAGETTPADRARAAAHCLDDPALASIERAAARATAALARLGANLTHNTTEPIGPTLWKRACVERDLLESALWTLRAAGRGGDLARELAAIDYAIGVQTSALAHATERVVDDHLRTVAWQEPEHWWGLND